MPAQQFGELPLMYSRISGPDHLDWEEWFWTMGIDFETANPLYIYDNYQFTIQAAIDGKGIALGYAGLIDHFIGRNLRGESGPQIEHRPSALFTEFEPNRLSQSRRETIYRWFRSEAGLG